MDPLQGFQPTKEVPGILQNLPEQIIDELPILNPRYRTNLSFFGGHPLSVTKKDQNQIFECEEGKPQSPYLICQKTDGVRYLCIVTNQCQYLISREGSKKLVSYRSNCHISKNWHLNPQYQFSNIVHILDGELITDKNSKGQQKLKYLIFDALVIFSKKIIEKPLRQRLQLCEKFMKCNQFLLDHYNQPDTPIEVKLKDFFRLTCNTYASSQTMRKKNLQSQPTTIQFLQKSYINALPHENDGIIFNNDEKPYLLGPNNGYLKWKPAAYNTVDFLVIPNTKMMGQHLQKRVLDLYLGWKDSQQSQYKMMFYNFTVVENHQFEILQQQFHNKYEAAYNKNPDLVTEDSFGVIAECITRKVQVGSQQAQIMRQLLSSTVAPEDIHQLIMRTQNQQKQLQVIKKLQGMATTKLWKIFRVRKDKDLPNNYQVVNKIEQSIKDDIKFQDLVVKNKMLLDKKRIR